MAGSVVATAAIPCQTGRISRLLISGKGKYASQTGLNLHLSESLLVAVDEVEEEPGDGLGQVQGDGYIFPEILTCLAHTTLESSKRVHPSLTDAPHNAHW